MTNLEQIRRNIGDTLKVGETYREVKNSSIKVYTLSNQNINAVETVRHNETALTVTTQYTLSAEKGILTIDNSVTLAEGDVIQVIYTYSSLSDTEINDALSSSNDSVNGASVTCIEWILADASKLHDYASGSEDMKLSQVVKNLQDLRNILKKKQEEELTAGDQGLRLVGYNTDPQSDCYPSRPRDISRINW